MLQIEISANHVKVKHDVKAKLTIQSSGASGGEGARTHIQGTMLLY